MSMFTLKCLSILNFLLTYNQTRLRTDKDKGFIAPARFLEGVEMMKESIELIVRKRSNTFFLHQEVPIRSCRAPRTLG
jgi:hypothetical protein